MVVTPFFVIFFHQLFFGGLYDLLSQHFVGVLLPLSYNLSDRSRPKTLLLEFAEPELLSQDATHVRQIQSNCYQVAVLFFAVVARVSTLSIGVKIVLIDVVSQKFLVFGIFKDIVRIFNT
jgi:hypothetical protein